MMVLAQPIHASPFNPQPEDRLIHIGASPAPLIPVRLWGNQSDPTMIILGVHGFSDYARGFAHLLPALDPSAKGLLIAFDQRGFGEHSSRGQWAGVESMIEDLYEVLTYITERYPRRPIHIIGESMGAALVLISMHHPKTSALYSDSSQPGVSIRSSVLLAPAIWGWTSMPWYQRVSLRLLSQLAPEFKLSSKNARRLGVRPTDDPAVAEHLAKDPWMLRDIQVSMIAGLTELMSEASAHLPKRGHRSLVVIGTQDEVIPPAAYCEWLKDKPAMSSSQWFIQQDGFHMLTRQKRGEAIISLLQDFLNHQGYPVQQSKLPTKELKC